MAIGTFRDIRKIRKLFPNLNPSKAFEITSPETPDYNCIAWAANDVTRWWEPTRYWPPGVPRQYTESAYIGAFESLRYKKCESSEIEPGYEKVVLFLKDGRPKHMARQLEDGRWASKLGGLWDIEHISVAGLNGIEYGEALIFMRRAI